MQEWENSEFCNEYESIWEISVDEVHYGWLAPGEQTLGLLSDSVRENSNVLDVGCGMAQNLIALAKQGVSSYGLDISMCMLEKAHKLVAANSLEKRISLQQGGV